MNLFKINRILSFCRYKLFSENQKYPIKVQSICYLSIGYKIKGNIQFEIPYWKMRIK